MRLLMAAEFLALPENVVFAMYAHGEIGPLCVKGATRDDNASFLYSEITAALVRPAGTEPIRELLQAAQKGENIEMDFQTEKLEREVMPRQLFMAWDREDVTSLIERLMPCLKGPKAPETKMPFFPSVKVFEVTEDPMKNEYQFSPENVKELVEAQNRQGGVVGLYYDKELYYSKEPALMATNFRIKNDWLCCDIRVLDTPAGARMSKVPEFVFKIRGYQNRRAFELVAVDAYQPRQKP